jgi:hypothetical protein
MTLQFDIPRDISNITECAFYHYMDLPGIGEVGDHWDLRRTIEEYFGGFETGTACPSRTLTSIPRSWCATSSGISTARSGSMPRSARPSSHSGFPVAPERVFGTP